MDSLRDEVAKLRDEVSQTEAAVSQLSSPAGTPGATSAHASVPATSGAAADAAEPAAVPDTAVAVAGAGTDDLDTSEAWQAVLNGTASRLDVPALQPFELDLLREAWLLALDAQDETLETVEAARDDALAAFGGDSEIEELRAELDKDISTEVRAPCAVGCTMAAVATAALARAARLVRSRPAHGTRARACRLLRARRAPRPGTGVQMDTFAGTIGSVDVFLFGTALGNVCADAIANATTDEGSAPRGLRGKLSVRGGGGADKKKRRPKDETEELIEPLIELTRSACDALIVYNERQFRTLRGEAPAADDDELRRSFYAGVALSAMRNTLSLALGLWVLYALFSGMFWLWSQAFDVAASGVGDSPLAHVLEAIQGSDSPFGQ